MRTEPWYCCDRHCGYRTQDKDEMERHECCCRFERLPVWQVQVILDIDREPSFKVSKSHFDVCDGKDRDRCLSRDAELEYAVADAYYSIRKFVATEEEVPAALEECKTKLREFLLRLAGEVDGLKVEQS